MTYVQSNLLPNERVVCVARVHVCVFAPGFILLVLSMLHAAVGAPAQNAAYAVLVLTAIVLLVSALLFRTTTQLAVTTSRVIVKTGMIRRHIVELKHSEVEGFEVSQGSVGRLMGFGTLAVIGMGGVRTSINGIDSPRRFLRCAIAEVNTTLSAMVADRKVA